MPDVQASGSVPQITSGAVITKEKNFISISKGGTSRSSTSSLVPMRSQIELVFALLHKNCEIRLSRLLSSASAPLVFVLSFLRFSHFHHLLHPVFTVEFYLSHTLLLFLFLSVVSLPHSVFFKFPNPFAIVFRVFLRRSKFSAPSLILLRDACYHTNRSSLFHSWKSNRWGSKKIQSRMRSWTQETERNRLLE